MKKIFICLWVLSICSIAAIAQEFEIKNYDINATVDKDAYAVEVQAKLRVTNLNGKELLDKILMSTNEKPRLTFFLNPKAKVSAMKINGASVQQVSAADRYLPLQRVTTDITSAYAAMPEFDVELTYAVPSPDRSASLHVSDLEGFALPINFWIPVIHTPYADHGADSAPFTLKVISPTGKVVASGNRKDDTTFEQTLAGQPFFFFGDYEVTSASTAKNGKVEVYAPKGMSDTGKQQAQRLADEAVKILDYYTGYFKATPIGPFRIIATATRNLTFSEPGAVAIDDSYFRRNVLDLGSIELMASAATKSFVDGRVLLRGRGAGMMRDGLAVYMSAQYLGARFGATQREAAFERYRRAYEPLARGSDMALAQLSTYERNYTSVMYNKGALVWRLLEKRLGKEAFDDLIRSLLDRQQVDVLTLGEWKTPLCRAARCKNVKAELLTAAGAKKEEMQSLFSQWVETITVPDFAVGQPQNSANGIESTVVNFGSGEMMVDVIAITETGEKLVRPVMVKGGEYGAVNFPAGTRIARVEIDPEKFYPQKDYSNDLFPRQASINTLYGQALQAFDKKDYVNAEARLREALQADANLPTLQALLGRVLLATGKTNEAAQAFADALKREALPLQAFAWANLGLGQIALQGGKAAEAAGYFRLSAAAEIDPATTLAARDGAAKAEQSANTRAVADDVKSFIKRLDDALLQGSSEAVTPLVEPANLREFVKRVTTNKPALWSTEILRAENWDADHVAVDVNLKVKVLGKEGTGRALYVLNRSGGRLRLSEVPIFDVK